MEPSSTYWSVLKQHYQNISKQTLKELFKQDDQRFEKFSISFDDLLIDFSKEKINQTILNSLFDLAKSKKVEEYRDHLFDGARLNNTEHRSVLHMALREGAGQEVIVDDQDIMPEVRFVRDRFLAFAEQVRDGRFATIYGERFTDVVNIGIGGSDLGPKMATSALRFWHDGPNVHYVSNVDSAHLEDTLVGLDQKTTLIIVSSKTFTTAETMMNASSARQWLLHSLGEENVGKHFAAISSNVNAAKDFGIDPNRVFGFWDWVGGRYSIWSAIGLPLAIAIGAENFRAFLKGGADMDKHFKEAPLEENLPVVMALLGIWRRNVMDMPTLAIMPYDQRLSRFPAFIQQLDMESNGKRINREGQLVDMSTGSIIWGEAGTNAQHSFFQMIHQGTDLIPVDFLLAANTCCLVNEDRWQQKHHDLLIANALAQGNALAFGRSQQRVENRMRKEGFDEEKIKQLSPHRTFPGDRPSTIILYRYLNPRTLGRLIALYEHKVFIQGVIWGINSYDQWGVELGKVLASNIEQAIHGTVSISSFDASTLGAINHINGLREEEKLYV